MRLLEAARRRVRRGAKLEAPTATPRRGNLSMPMNFARRLVGIDRTASADRRLGATLAFVAGAMNAGGFLAVHQYTSHMTGIVSALADHVAGGGARLAGA